MVVESAVENPSKKNEQNDGKNNDRISNKGNGQQQQESFRVELILWAKGLANLDKFSKSDPLCVVEQSLDGERKQREGEWAEIDRTEAIMNNLNPKWNKKVHLDFHPGTRQELRFSCYDIDCNKEALTFHDFLGRCQCQLGDILNAPNGRKKLRLKKDTGAFAKGELFVHAERVDLRHHDAHDHRQQDMVQFEIRGLFWSPAQKQHHAIVGNARANVIKPTAPSTFLEFYRLEGEEKALLDDDDLLMVHRTEKIKSNWYPCWDIFAVPLRLLSHGDPKKKFLIHCIDKEANGESNKLIGTIRTSLGLLTSNGCEWRRELTNEEMAATATESANAIKKRQQRDVNKKRGHLHFIQVRRQNV